MSNSPAYYFRILASSGVYAANFFFVFILLFYSQSITAAENPVSRVLSLDLCTDWMLARYADRSQVLAMSPLIRQYPVDWVGQDWPVHDGNLESILELNPDLVITGEHNALMLRRRLQDLGMRVEILTLPKNLSQVKEYEQNFLSLLGLTTGKTGDPDTHINNNRHTARPTRLLLLGANGIGTGQQTFENDILQHAGWSNYLQENGYITLDLEQIVNDPPDAVLWSAPASVALSTLFAKHPVLKHTLRAEQWLKTEPWKWQCPGPWSWQLVNQLETGLKP